MTIDYQIRLIDFHNGKIREAVTPNDDGSYTIFIEASLSRTEQQEECLHALNHIKNGDFEKRCTGLVEIWAHMKGG